MKGGTGDGEMGLTSENTPISADPSLSPLRSAWGGAAVVAHSVRALNISCCRAGLV